MVDSGTTRVITSLLRDRLADTKAFDVIQAPGATRIYATAPAESLARLLGADKFVMGNVTFIGRKYLVSYKLLNVSTGAIELSDRASADYEGDFDILTQRIATAMKQGNSFQTTLELGNVTGPEGNLLAHTRQPLSSILFTTGYTIPISHALPYDPGSMLFTLDAAVTYETPNYLASGQMGIMRGAHGFTDVHFEMLAHKLFSTKDIAPFLGAGMGVHRIWFRPPANEQLADRDVDGLSLIANGGVLLFRTYYFRAIADARASILFTGNSGPVTSAGLGFGLTSPEFGPEGTLKTPPACIYGTLGAFFLTGLIVALVN